MIIHFTYVRLCSVSPILHIKLNWTELNRHCAPVSLHYDDDGDDDDYMEDKLFTSVINNDKHVLSHILPDPDNHTYNLRRRPHELTLAIKGDARNFFERQYSTSTIVFYRTRVYQMQPRNGRNSYRNVATTVAKLPKLEFAHL